MTTGEQHPQLLALDWGSSRLRAFLMCRGEVLASRESAHGILNLPVAGEGGFALALNQLVGDWRARWPSLPTLACGMVGSAQGWREVPYALCPADVRALAAQCLQVETGHGRPLWIVPGVIDEWPGRLPDVMRGEETQLCGALGDPVTDEGGSFILPGTHSKWVRVEAGRIEGFASYLTGELYAVLRAHSILGRLMPAGECPFDADAFRRGVITAAERPSALTHLLFSVRTLALTGRLPPASLPDYLSGLLIGQEVVAGRADGLPGPCTLIGAPALCARYVQAFVALGEAPPALIDNTAPRGLWRLAVAGGHLSEER